MWEKWRISVAPSGLPATFLLKNTSLRLGYRTFYGVIYAEVFSQQENRILYYLFLPMELIKNNNNNDNNNLNKETNYAKHYETLKKLM